MEIKLSFRWGIVGILILAFLLVPLGVLFLRTYAEAKIAIVWTEALEDEFTADQRRKNEAAEVEIDAILVNDSKSPHPDGYPESARNMESRRARRIILQARLLQISEEFQAEEAENQIIIALYARKHKIALSADFVKRSFSSQVVQDERKRKILSDLVFKQAINPWRLLSKITISEGVSVVMLLVLILMWAGMKD